MHPTKWHSFCSGQLSEGCKRCVHGRKLVLFITGVCAQRCWYCPIGENKFGSDVVFANEWKLQDPNDPVELLEEAKLTKATGAGITGGDPLTRVDRCAQYIKLLKSNFGKDFHIHLYTPLKLVTEERLKKLHDAGLDEIRFHPDLDNKEWWSRINLANKFKWHVGIEIPAIPGYVKQTKELVDFVAKKVEFINLNELERSDTQALHYQLDKKGFKQKDELSYGVKGSKNMALEIIDYAQTKGLPAHYCTAKLKDSVQVKQRLLLRAESTALPFDEKTEDGTLLRGCVYLRGLEPGFKTKERLNAIPLTERKSLLDDMKKELETDGIPDDKLIIDAKRARIIVPRVLVEKRTKLLKSVGIPALIEEYPTADAMIVDVQFAQ